MKAAAFVRVASVSDLKDSGPFALAAAGTDIVVVRAAGGWRAFQGRCPHQGALLGEGEVESETLVCRNHRWRFLIDSGQRVDGPERLASCSIVERDGALFVDASGVADKTAPAPKLRSIDDLPGPKPLPLIGNLLALEPKRMHLILENWAAKYGPTYRFRLGPKPIVVTADPALIQASHRARPETFRRQARMDDNIRDMGIEGVFNAEGDAWRSQRRLTVAALAQRHLRELYPAIETVTNRLRARWVRAADAGDTLDILEELKLFTVDVTMLVVFGHDSNTVEQSGDVIQRHLEVVFPIAGRRLFAFLPLWRYVPTVDEIRLQRALKAIRAWLERLISEARARLAADPRRAARPANFLEAMLASRDDSGAPYSDRVIMSNAITLLLAGEDTTANTMAWAIHHLCDDPHWALKLRAEADAELGARDAPDSIDAANRLALAGAVAHETMRLRPVGPVGILEANVDARLGDFLLPKGASLAVLLRPPAVDSARFQEPLAFRPERWLEDDASADALEASTPFGAGPRICPGRSLALAEMKTLLAMLFKSFDVARVGASADVAEVFGFAMSPQGLRVRLRKRAATPTAK